MSEPHTPVIVYSSRTAIGKLSGAFATVPAPLLGAALVQDASTKLGLKSGEIDEIIMGNVLTAGVGQAPARQTAILGGLADSVAATTVNKVCGSGLKAVALAAQAIRLGDAQFVLAGGQENMSRAPHLLMDSRNGFKFGAVEMKDSMQWDGLWDPYMNVAMGNCGEICAKEYQFSREAQDAYAVESYRRARAAIESGFFAGEIVPVSVQVRKDKVSVTADEEPFAADLERISSLRPAFAKDGTITAANASSINDGAALLGITSLATAKARHYQPLAKIVAYATVAQEPKWFTTAPIAAIQKILQQTGLSIKDIDAFEINEAFAVVAMAAIKTLQLDPARVNPRGGAVALGHPIGASGARVLVTLLHHLHETKQRRGIATLCIGGGEAIAVLVERF